MTKHINQTPSTRGPIFLILLLIAGWIAGVDGHPARAQTPVPKPGPKPATTLDLTLPDAADPIVITGDELDWDTKHNLITLTGNVVVVHPRYRVTADRAEADVVARTIKAYGHVTLTALQDGEATQVLSADEVRLDATAGTGWMLKGKLTVPWEATRFQFEGDRVERIDQDTYLIERGSFTWCNCAEGEAPDWSVNAEKIQAKPEGDVIVENALINIRNHPVFPLPYFRYPLGTERRTGFLFPIIETDSSDGFQLELPFYVVVNRSADFTLGPRYIYDRGIEAGLEVRANYGEPAATEFRSSVIDDGQESQWRGGGRIIHRTDLDDRFTIAADVAIISDNEVLFDFDHRNLGRDDQRALESRIYLASHWPAMNLTAEFASFDDLMGGDVRDSPFGVDRDPQMVQRLPAVTYTILTRPLAGPAVFDLAGSAINYYRQDGDLGKGQLVSLYPRVALPFRLFDAVDFWAAGGYRGWFGAPNPEIEGDQFYTGRAEAEFYLSSQWERLFQYQDRRWRHSFRPSLIGYYADRPEAPDDIFFAQIIPDRAVELGGLHLDSRLWSRPNTVGPAVPAETARFELTQLYDFEAQDWRDLRLETRLGAPTPWLVAVDAYFSWEQWEWTRLAGLIGYRFEPGLILSAGYRKDTGNVRSPYFDFETVENESITGSVAWRGSERHRFEYRAYYSLEYDMMVRQSFEYNYLARQQCWGMDLKVGDRLKPSDPEQHELSGSVNLRIAAPNLP